MSERPYLLVLHPESGQSAAYNRRYRLMFEDASVELIGHAMKHHSQVKAGFRLSLPEQQPSWMGEEIEGECICIHTYKDGAPRAWYEAIPER